MEPNLRKDALRRLVLARRSRLDAEERESLAASLTDRLLALPEVAEADRVCAYVSISSEVPTGMLLAAVLGAGKTLLLPYVADDGSLRASAIASPSELAPGYRGIPEPRARFPVDVATVDVIVVPGVAFDPTGARLGFGGGFYDAFLRGAPRVARVGVCFELQIVDDVPSTERDERVDAIVTEERVIRCARGENRA